MAKPKIGTILTALGRGVTSLGKRSYTMRDELQKLMPGKAARTAAGERVLATRRYVQYSIMPLWFISGLLDYVCHRRSKIETTSGITESAIHSLMMAESAIPVLAGLLLEINATGIVISLVSFVAHQATALWDVAYTVKRRKVTPMEQHIHGALEMLPFCALSFILCLHWDQLKALFAADEERPSLRFEWKNTPLPRAYIGSIMTTMSLLGVLYSEEMWRCIDASRKGLGGVDIPPAARELFGSQ